MNTIQLFLALFFMKMIGIFAISSSSNEPIADNPLQLISRDCALQYCSERDGLSLWLTLQNACLRESANPYFLEHVERHSEYMETLSPFTSGTMCAFVAFVSFFLGYMISAKEKKGRIEDYKI